MFAFRSSAGRHDEAGIRVRGILALVLGAVLTVASTSNVSAQPKETVLANGIRVIEIAPVAEEARPTSVADLEIWVPAGAWFEPDTSPGLATATAETLLRAGTKWHGDAEIVAKLREKYGIHLEAKVGSEYVRFQLWCEEPQARAFASGLLVALLSVPNAGEDHVAEALAAIAAERDPARAEFARKQVGRAWSDRHPAARPARGNTPTWDGVVGFYGHYRPNGVIVGSQGPLSPPVLAMLERWKVEGDRPAHSEVSVSPGSGPSITIVPSEKEVGAVLVRGVAGLDAATRTRWLHALLQFDENRGAFGSTILPAGGGRMTVRIPIAPGEGLASSIHAGIDRLAKFPAQLAEDSSDGVMPIDGGRPGDVWASAVMSAAGTGSGGGNASDWFDLTQYHLVVHGPMALAPELGRYGISVEIAPVGEYPRDGSELWAEIVAAAGGEGLDAVKALGWTATRYVNSEEGVQESKTRSIVEFPLRLWSETESPVATQITVFNGSKGWTSVIRKPSPDLPNPTPTLDELPEPSARDFRSSLLLATTPLLCAHREVEVVELVPEFIEGATLRVVRVTRPNVGSVEFLVEAETFRIRRKRMTQNSSRGQILVEEALDRYTEVDGIWLPQLRTIYQNAVERVRIATSEFQVNPEIPAGRFDPPSKTGQP